MTFLYEKSYKTVPDGTNAWLICMKFHTKREFSGLIPEVLCEKSYKTRKDGSGWHPMEAESACLRNGETFKTATKMRANRSSALWNPPFHSSFAVAASFGAAPCLYLSSDAGAILVDETSPFGTLPGEDDLSEPADGSGIVNSVETDRPPESAADADAVASDTLSVPAATSDAVVPSVPSEAVSCEADPPAGPAAASATAKPAESAARAAPAPDANA